MTLRVVGGVGGLFPAILVFVQLPLPKIKTLLPVGALLCAGGVLALGVAGCKGPVAGPVAATGAEARPVAAGQDFRRVDAERQEMELVPPPSKNRYLAVRSLADWDNPFLTVQNDVLTLHVMQADPLPASMGQGTLLRPTAARRRDLSIRLADLPDALTALPANDWPYGRVIAVEEQRGISAAERPAMRRNMEAAIKTLTDLGIVVDEWNDNGTTNTMQ